MSKTKTKAEAIERNGTPQPPSKSEDGQPATSREDRIRELLKDRPIYVNSIAAGLLGLDHGSVLREMQNARGEMIRFYMSEQGGKLSADEARIRVDTYLEDVDEAVSRMLSQPADMASVQRQLHFHRRQLEFPFHSIKLSASPRIAF